MSTITRKSIEAQIDELWEKAKAIGNTDAMEELLEIMKEFYGVKSKPTNPEPHTTIDHEHLIDHREEDIMDMYEYDGYTGQYDQDTGCFCVDYRK